MTEGESLTDEGAPLEPVDHPGRPLSIHEALATEQRKQTLRMREIKDQVYALFKPDNCRAFALVYETTDEGLTSVHVGMTHADLALSALFLQNEATMALRPKSPTAVQATPEVLRDYLGTPPAVARDQVDAVLSNLAANQEKTS